MDTHQNVLFGDDAEGSFSFAGIPESHPAYDARPGRSSAGPGYRPSLFSNGTGSASATLPYASTTLSNTREPAAMSAHVASSSSLQPLATLAGKASSPHRSLTDASDDTRSSSHRPRIPRVEKDADDPTTPVQSRDASSRAEDTTSTTLTRLLAVSTHTPFSESRSTSYIVPLEDRPRNYAAEPLSMTDHLYNEGLLNGRHSDITVHAFGCAYKLHRLLLVRAPFFDTALSGSWLESIAKEIVLHPEDIDHNITQGCFELALKRLYGAKVESEEASEAVGLFATGCWLEMPDLIDSSIDSMLRQMSPGTLTPLIKFVTSNYYGRAGDKILASAKAMLCRDGWKMPIKHWDGVPTDIVREILGGDGFFINSEFDRWLLAKRILNRRLKHAAIEVGLIQPGAGKVEAPDAVKLMAVRFDNVYRKNAMRAGSGLPDSAHRWIALYTHPDIEPLLVLLDEGIHYLHLEFEHLQYIRKTTDIFGLPILPDKVISDALWMQLDIRQRVLNAPDGCMELGLSKLTSDYGLDSPTTQIPVASLPESPPRKGKQRASVGTASSEDDDIPSNSWDSNGKPRKFWIPSSDCNIVMGGNTDPVMAAAPSPNAQRHVSRLSGTLQPEDVQWAADFGAATNDSRPGPAVRPAMFPRAPTVVPELKPLSYSHYPPFRFAAEFPNPRLLKEKKRVYSRTIFYAGSLWNIYIQKVRSSKNPQLGVYLHRAKERETEEVVVSASGAGNGSVDERIGYLEREMLLRSQRNRRRGHLDVDTDHGADDGESSGSNDHDLTQGGGRARANTGRLSEIPYRKTRQNDIAAQDKRQSTSSSDNPRRQDYDSESSSDGDEYNLAEQRLSNASAPHTQTLPAYVDARPTIKTYFKIYSPSKGGRMLSVYESAPDRFNFSQSWGWKSSTLMLDEGIVGEGYSGVVPDFGESLGLGGSASGVGGEDVPIRRADGGRLRFMVVIGNV